MGVWSDSLDRSINSWACWQQGKQLQNSHNLKPNSSQDTHNASQLSGKLHYGLSNVIIIGRQTVTVNHRFVDHQLQLGVDAWQACQTFRFLHELRHAVWAVVVCTQVKEGKNVVNELGKMGGASNDGGDIRVPHATGHRASHCRMRVHHVTWNTHTAMHPCFNYVNMFFCCCFSLWCGQTGAGWTGCCGFWNWVIDQLIECSHLYVTEHEKPQPKLLGLLWPDFQQRSPFLDFTSCALLPTNFYLHKISEVNIFPKVSNIIIFDRVWIDFSSIFCSPADSLLVHVGLYSVPIIHQTLTWTAGSWICIYVVVFCTRIHTEDLGL